MNKPKEPVTFLMAKLIHFSGHLKKHIVTYCFLFLISNIIMLLGPIIFGLLIAEIQKNGVSNANLGRLMLLLGLLFLKELGFWLFHGVGRIIERMVAFQAELNYRRYLLKGVIDLGLSWHAEKDSGDTIDKVNKASTSLFEFGEEVFNIVMVIVKLVGTSLVLFWFSPWIGVAVFLFVIFSFAVLFSFDKHLIPQYRGINNFANQASAALFDALSNISTVKILHIEKPIVKGVMDRFSASRNLFRANAILNEWKWFTGNMLLQLLGVLPIAFYMYRGIKNGQAIDAGEISTLYLYLTSLLWVFFTFGDLYEKFAIFANRVINAEALEHAIAFEQTENRRAVLPWDKLRLNINFAYDKGENILKDVSLAINRGDRIAVIGESGSGKTTFLKVLHGMYQKALGQIEFDDQKKIATNFADLDLKTMLVPQEPEIFSSTIRENITLALDFSDEEVRRVASIAAFFETIEELPRGLDSVINEKGVNLSGGQKQRLALTRALLFAAKKEVLLLDESTSSVDPENEELIYQNILREYYDKTIIASVHKMNLLKFFDRIIIFDRGRIVAEGSFVQLLEKNTAFKEAWAKFIATK